MEAKACETILESSLERFDCISFASDLGIIVQHHTRLPSPCGVIQHLKTTIPNQLLTVPEHNDQKEIRFRCTFSPAGNAGRDALKGKFAVP